MEDNNHGWITSIKYTRISAWECPSTDVRESSPITDRTRHARITVRNTRRFTMSTWRKCWTSVRAYWSSHVWNMFDFGCAARDEGGVAGRNNKGLVTMDRKTKKDSYYIYKAYWNKAPMVHICGRRYAQRAGETTEIRVYSNQPTVTLYLNGEKAEEKSAEKVFVFTVALAEGQNIVVAEAGGVKDSITLEKVEKEPEIYVLPEVNERAEGVANWFSTVGEMDLKAPMEFPEGKYNIYCTMEEIAESPEALAVLTEAVKLAMNMKVTPGAGMWDMMKGMTPGADRSDGRKYDPGGIYRESEPETDKD